MMARRVHLALAMLTWAWRGLRVETRILPSVLVVLLVGVAMDSWGIVTSSGRLRFLCPPGSQRDEENQLRRLPIPARDHSAGDLALPPVHAELARCRGLIVR